MKRLAQLFSIKYASELKKLAVSNSFSLLGEPTALFELQKLVSQKMIPRHTAMQIAEDKFNQLVAPYLKIKSVNLTKEGELEMFLHDLIHEALREGSIADFKQRDNSEIPSHLRYDLKDHVDEAIAETFSSGVGDVPFSVFIEELAYKIDFKSINSVADLAKAVDQECKKALPLLADSKARPHIERIFKHLVLYILQEKSIAEKLEKSKEHESLNGAWLSIFNRDLAFKARQLFEKISKRSVSIMDDELKATLIRRWIVAVHKAYSDFKVT